MTPDRTSRELIETLRDEAQTALPDCAVTAAFRAAEHDAGRAYEVWRGAPNVDAYVAFLAAEERASAAEDEMTTWAKARREWAGGSVSTAA